MRVIRSLIILIFASTASISFGQGSFATGSLAGKFEVDGSGAATYTVALKVPPGTHGMAPKLSLTYHSNGGNGILGQAWTLGGLHVITRIPATLAQDGRAGAINYDRMDRFSLDGQRLIVVTGEYGANNAIYRTELESWSRVVSHLSSPIKGPAYFLVTRKDGTLMEYGRSPNSRIRANGKNTVRVWALNKVIDLNGNEMVLTYQNDDHRSGQFTLRRIDYTQHRGQNLKMRSVHFHYDENRRDVYQGYTAGSVVKKTMRLARITMRVNSGMAREYRMDYRLGAVTKRTLLQTITEYGSDGQSALAPTAFTWSSRVGNGFSKRPSPERGSLIERNVERINGDFNGDGRTDIAVFKPTGATHSQVVIYFADQTDSNSFSFRASAPKPVKGMRPKKLTGDFNGDGKLDFALFSPARLWSTIPVYLSNGDGTFQLIERPIPGGSPHRQGVIQIGGDYNGDGLTDFALFHPRIVQGKIPVYLADGSGGFSLVDGALPGGPITDSGVIRISGHFNNDSLTDFAVFKPGDLWKTIPIYLAKGDGTFRLVNRTVNGEILRYGTEKIVGDFNGDGLSDISVFQPGARWTTQPVYLAKGDGSFAYVNRPIEGPITMQARKKFAGDFNGDGYTDFAVLDPEYGLKNASLYFSNGNGSFEHFPVNGPERKKQYKDVVGDFDGDGLLDFLLVREGFQREDPLVYLANRFPERLTGITNGHGGRIQIEYRPITDDAIYASGTGGATYPVMFAQSPLYVVSKSTVEDRRSHSYPTTYRYEGSRTDLRGRGWLGFAKISMKNLATGLINRTTFLQSFPLTGSIGEERQLGIPTQGGDPMCLSETRLNQTIHEYSARQAPQGVFQVMPVRETTHRFHYGQAGGVAEKTFTYDNFGNPSVVKQSERNHPQADVTHTYEYYNNTELNRLGYVKRATTLAGPASELMQETRFEYDDKMNLARKRVLQSAEPNIWLETRFNYDVFGNQTQVIHPGMGAFLTVYDEHYQSFPVREITPANQQGKKLEKIKTYDPRFGLEKSLLDSNGNKLVWAHDPFGRITSISQTSPGGRLVLTDRILRKRVGEDRIYETMKRLRWDEDAWWVQRKFIDGLSRIYRTETQGHDADRPIIVERFYNDSGKVEKESTPYFATNDTPKWTHLRYDLYGRLTQKSFPNGRIDRHNYLPQNRVETLLAADSPEQIRNLAHYGYFAGKNQIAKMVFANGHQVNYDYDAMGRMTAAVTAEGMRLVQVSFNLLGNETQVQRPGFSESMQYDQHGRLITKKRGEQIETNATFDELGRVLKREFKKGQQTKSVSYTYGGDGSNTLGRISHITDGSGHEYRFSYDPLGRSTGESVIYSREEKFELTKEYDIAGRLTGMTYPDGSQFQIERTANGFPLGVTGENLRVQFESLTTKGRPQAVALSNGVNYTLAYSSEGFLQQVQVNKGDETYLDQTIIRNLHHYIECTNETSSVSSKTDKASAQPRESAFSYDNLGQLKTATGRFGTLNYDYDGNGVMKSIDGYTVAYDPGNYQVIRMKDSQGTTVLEATYDDGRMVGKRDQNGSWKYEYNALNRLAKVTKDDVQIAQYGYDHQGRRVKRRGSDGTLTFDVVPEYRVTVFPDGTRQQTKRIDIIAGHTITITTGANPPDARGGYNRTGTYFGLSNPLASNILVTDHAGNLASRLAYKPFGAFNIIAGRDVLSQKFSGKEWDAESRLYYFNARYYDPFSARFLTADTKLGAESAYVFNAFKPYAYAGNNPINYIDPSGHNFLSSFFGFLIGLSETIAGGALDVMSAGSLSHLGGALIGAGVNAMVYSASHNRDFDWKEYGSQQAVGAVGGMLFGGAGRAEGMIENLLVSSSRKSMLKVGAGFIAGAASSVGSQEMGNVLHGASASNISVASVGISAVSGGIAAGVNAKFGRAITNEMEQLEVGSLRTLRQLEAYLGPESQALQPLLNPAAAPTLAQLRGTMAGLRQRHLIVQRLRVVRFNIRPGIMNLHKIIGTEGIR